MNKILGQFSHGNINDVFLDATRSLEMVEVTKAHENEHRILEYSTSHGLFTTFLIMLEDTGKLDKDLLNEIAISIELLSRNSFYVHEGCATYLTLNMVMAMSGNNYADSFLKRIPIEYRKAASIYSDCLSATRDNATLSPFVLKNLDYLIHAFAIASMNSDICNEFYSVHTFNYRRLGEYLKENSPTLRLINIRDAISEKRMIEAFVNFCTQKVLELAKGLPIFDNIFMSEYIRKNPLEFEDMHRKIEMEMRSYLIDWMVAKKIVSVDKTINYIEGNTLKWSPSLLFEKWEKELGINVGLMIKPTNSSEVSLEEHITAVHTTNFNLSDNRIVHMLKDNSKSNEVIKQFQRKTNKAIIKLCYNPEGQDFPQVGIYGKNRFNIDIAPYGEDFSFESTLYFHAIKNVDLNQYSKLFFESVFLMTEYNFSQLLKDGKKLPVQKLYVFLNVSNSDLFEFVDNKPCNFKLKYCESFPIKLAASKEIVIPGIIQLSEEAIGSQISYFVIADKYLRNEGVKLLLKRSNVQESFIPLSFIEKLCAVEASYGVLSCIDRILVGQFQQY